MRIVILAYPVLFFYLMFSVLAFFSGIVLGDDKESVCYRPAKTRLDLMLTPPLWVGCTVGKFLFERIDLDEG